MVDQHERTGSSSNGKRGGAYVRRSLGGLAGIALLFASGIAGAEPDASAQAGPTRDQCLSAHQQAQELKRKGSLLEAQAQLSICSSVGCPGAIISDCGQWIADLEQTTPSMVFEVRVDGKQVSDYQVQVDGTPVTDASKAFKVNPGRHVVRAELPSHEPQEETLVLPEGQRMRLVSFEFKSPRVESAPLVAPAPPVSPPVAASRPVPTAVYPLLGFAVAGFGSFGVFSYLGHTKQSDLEGGCSPHCTDEDLKPMKQSYLIGDISAGVGAAALITAGILYFTRPARAESALSVQVGSASPRDPGSLAISVGRSW